MSESKIQVIIRKRPLNEKESLKGQSDIVIVPNNSNTTLIVRQPKLKLDLTKYTDQHFFEFDAVLNQQIANNNIYQYYIRPILRHAFQGNKATIFAYGQTGSGKTFTMNGNQKKGIYGIYDFVSQDIFNAMQHELFKNCSVCCNFYELYCQKVYDLLNQKKQLKIYEDRKKMIQITGTQPIILKSSQDFMKCIKSGMNLRTTSQNATNLQSSRSHAILQISICDQNGKIFGQISFIDLAGSQRGADTIHQAKQTKIDGAEINKSLLALKQCIRAMDNNNKHIPFRGSKLTMILRDSFGNNCKTLMIGNISPGSGSCENTLNTLRYCATVKQLKQSKQNLTKADLKAKQLMLPRSNKNRVSVVQMQQQPVGFQRLSLRNSNIKNKIPEQNNRNFRNTMSDTKNKVTPKKVQSQSSSSIFSVRKLQTNSQTGPLSFHDFQDWDDSVDLLRKWDINAQPLDPYQDLLSTIRSYLQRQLKQYLSLCQQNHYIQSTINQQNVQILRQIYSNQSAQNQTLYQKSVILSEINQQKVQLINKQETKLRSYMSHLQVQEQCDRKMKQALQIVQMQQNQSHDDEMSMIDEVTSEWSEELPTFDRPKRSHNGVVTRQSLNLQKEHLNININVLKSFEYR